MIVQDWELTVLNRLAQMCAKKGYNFENGYTSDFVHDIQTMEQMPLGTFAYILVRKCGTSFCRTADHVKELNRPEVIGEAIALIHVTRNAWDGFALNYLDPRDYVGEYLHNSPQRGKENV